MKYFTTVQNLDEAKAEFRKLSIKLHPDTSGYNSQSDFINMMNEFKAITNKLKFNTGFDADKDFNADKFYNIIKKFDGLTDINISFVGSFIWLTDAVYGAMYKQKDVIKGIQIEGLKTAKWASKKKSWYFSPEGYKQYSKSNKDLEANQSYLWV